MKSFFKIFLIIIPFLFSHVKASSLYGSGDLEISKALYNYINEYLGSGIKNKNEGSKSRGRGTYLAISTTADWGSSSYCPYTKCQDDGGLRVKRNCEKGAKKKTGKKETCKLLFKGHTIKWNGNKIKVGKNDDLAYALNQANITVKGLTKKNNSPIKTKSKEKKIDKSDISKKLNDLNELFKSGALTKKEFESAKKRILD